MDEYEEDTHTVVCDECGDEFTGHRRETNGTTIGCSAEASANSQLRKHMKTHDERTKDFQCTRDGCTKAYYDQHDLNRHLGNTVHYRLVEAERGEVIGTVRAVEIELRVGDCVVVRIERSVLATLVLS